jgi:hypothetical protein
VFRRRFAKSIFRPMENGTIANPKMRRAVVCRDTLPDTMVPDISEGRMFSQWLRDEKKIDPTTFPTYKHRYEDGRVVEARLYPNALLAEFRAHFDGVWLPERCQDYFAERDPKALPFLPALLSEPKKKLESGAAR